VAAPQKSPIHRQGLGAGSRLNSTTSIDNRVFHLLLVELVVWVGAVLRGGSWAR